MTPARQAGRAVWPAAVAVGLVAEWRLHGWSDAGGWVPDVLTGWSLIGCGLTGWRRRPGNWSGALLAAAGFAWFVPDLMATSVGPLGWLGAPALYLYRGPLVQLVLTYPRGRVRGRREAGAVAVGYAAAVVTPLWGTAIGTVTLAAFFVAVAIRGYVRAAGRERRMRRSALQATALFAAVTVAVTAVRFAVPAPAVSADTLLAYEVLLCGLAGFLLIGLARWPWERADVADLVVELGETRAGTLRDQLARALGDPSLQVGYWVPGSSGFVDAAGRSVAVPDPGSGRATTVVERDGQQVAVLVHDPAVLDDQGLFEAVASAARLAAVNARLQAEVRASLAEVAASRRRILAAADTERHRLERRLMNGAHLRLERLAENLRLARQSASAEGTVERIARAELRLAQTKDDLERLARGLHPRKLSEHGLAAALGALADDSPLRIELDIRTAPASQAAAACAYFICSEGLANAAKHATASVVRISVTALPSRITVEVADDGAGGADPGGAGLRGLADRVETLGGTFTLASISGQGTRLTAVIPDGTGPG